MELIKVPMLDFFAKKIHCFGNIPEAYFFVPAKMAEYLIDTGILWQRSIIPDWELFEWGKHHYEDDTIENMIYGSAGNQSHMYLMTDEGIKDKVVFYIPASYPFGLFTKEYEEYYNMNFFQSDDYLAFFPDKKIINLIHHEGHLFTFNFSKESL